MLLCMFSDPLLSKAVSSQWLRQGKGVARGMTAPTVTRVARGTDCSMLIQMNRDPVYLDPKEAVSLPAQVLVVKAAYSLCFNIFLQEDLENTIGESASQGAAGIVLWGSEDYSNSRVS